MLDDLVEVYLEVYADEADDPFYSEDRYRQQITGHMKSPGWEMVTATVGQGGELAGYIYGTPLPAGTGRWRGLTNPLPDDFINETGHRTFAIAELLVREPWRGQGFARRLHDELLDHRPEERARLLVLPENSTAQAIYAHWGWHKVATLRPGWESAPAFDVLILPLNRHHAGI